MHRDSTVKNMNINYVTSNKPGDNITYIPKDKSGEQSHGKLADLIAQKDSKLKKNVSNLPSSKNHRSMLKLHEKGFKKVTSFFEREKSANNLSIKQQFNLDKTDNILEKYNKGTLSKIIEMPHTERSNFVGFEPPKLKQSKSKSRYDNEIFSSGEKEDHNKYKRKPSNNSRMGDINEADVKKSKDCSEVIKSLAKDDFNPFLFSNSNEHSRHGHELSERVTNKKMFSRVMPHLNQSEKSNTMNMKEQLEILKNDRNNKKPKPQSSNMKWHKNSTPNVDGRRGQELDIICEEYGSKIEDPRMVRDKMVRLQDVQKDYKTDQNDPKSQYNRYASNKHHKSSLRKPKETKHKENENTINDGVSKPKGESKVKSKKGKSRHHKKKAKVNTSF